MRVLYLAWLNVPVARPLLDKVMQRVFGELAESWDARTAYSDRLAPLDAALERVPHRPARVVDLGCGTGTATIALARRYESAWVIGIDISLEMLDRATQAARDAEVAIQFQSEPLQHTSLGNESVDLVALVNAPPPFDELARMLAPAGHAVVIFTNGPQTPFYSKPERLRRGFERAGMTEVARGSAGDGEYYVAAHAAVTARAPRAKQRAAQAARVPS